MKAKVEQYAKGEFNLQRPQVELSLDRLQLDIEAGSVYTGRIEVKSTNGQVIRGTLCDDHYLFQIHPTSFVDTKETLELTFHGDKWEKGQQFKGELYLITDGGEFTIPYDIRIIQPCVMSSQGKLTDLYQFAELARQDYSEAVRLFTQENFVRTFLMNEPVHRRVYESVIKSMSDSQAMEEFLVYMNKKRKVSLELQQEEVLIDKKAGQYSIDIRRNNWGYILGEIYSDQAFIRPIKTYITDSDFDGHIGQIQYLVLPEYISNQDTTAKLYIETVDQRLEISIRLKEEETSEDVVEEEPEPVNFREKLVETYIQYYTDQIQLEAYVEKSREWIKELQYNSPYPRLCDLALLHMNVLQGNMSLAKEEIKRIEADMEGIDMSRLERCYLTYIRALATREQEYIVLAQMLIEQGLVGNKHKLFYFWLWCFIGEDTPGRQQQGYDLICRLYEQGERSPVLNLELCNLFNSNTLLLRRLGDVEIAALSFGLDHNYITDELILASIQLATREYGFQKKIYDYLCQVYQARKFKECLGVICGILIRNNKIDEEYHQYYAEGIKNNFKLIGIYECYLRSMNKKTYQDIPEPIFRYLLYTNTLMEKERGYLYANLIVHKGEYASLFREMSNTIENFMEGQIIKGNIQEDLLVIYKEFLRPDYVNPRYAAQLPNIMFKKKITCHNDKIQSVMVIHPELEYEEKIRFVDGIAYVDVVSKDSIILLLDHRGNRYISTVQYQLESLVNPEEYYALAKQYNPESPQLLAYGYGKYKGQALREAKEVNGMRELFDAALISKELKQTALLHIIGYYMENYHREVLENYLLQVDFDYLDGIHSGNIIAGFIGCKLYRKAYEAIGLFGYGQVEDGHLLQLANHLVTDPEIMGQGLLNSLCVYLYQKKQYNEWVLQYLCLHYRGSVFQQAKLWDVARIHKVDTRELEENILAQSIFADVDPDNPMDIFLSYMAKRPRRMLMRGYLRRVAHQYLIQERRVEERGIDSLFQQVLQGDIEDDFSALALLTFMSRQPRLTREQEQYIQEKVEDFLNRGMVVPCFKSFSQIMDLPEEIFLKTYLVYKGEAHRQVIVQYKIKSELGREQDYRGARMDERLPGYYVQEFVIFHGEQFLYRFNENYTGRVELFESDARVYAKDEMQETRFSRINEMLICQEEEKDQELQKNMENYLHYSHITEELLNIVD